MLRPFLVPAILLTVSGGVVAWLLLAEPPEIPEKQVAGALRPGIAETSEDISRSEPSSPEPQSPTEAPSSAAPLPDDIRNVSPDGVSSPFVRGNLKRIDPSERFQELLNPPVEEIPDGPLQYRRVQVLDGGRIKAKQLVITLAHIEPLKIDEICVAEQGGEWPCGARARTFLRGLIRQFKVSCEKVADVSPRQIVATCKRGKMDLSSRLVRYGWADPAPDAPESFEEFALLAKERKLGKWREVWQHAPVQSGWDNDPNAPLPGLADLAPEIIDWSEQANSSDLNQESFGFEAEPAEDIPQQ